MCSQSIAEIEPSYLTIAQLAQRLQVSETSDNAEQDITTIS